MKRIENYFFVLVLVGFAFVMMACSNDDNQPVDDDNQPDYSDLPIDLKIAIEEYNRIKSKGNYIELSVPNDHPGPPFYARIANSQLIEAENIVIVPMFRKVECIDKDFNLLNFLDVPNAFFCSLNVNGKGLIEPNSSPETAPIIAYYNSSDMPVWFFDKTDMLTAIQDGILTLDELESLGPKKGLAKRYIEYERPRTGRDNFLVIESEGIIPGTNEQFEYKLNTRNKLKLNATLRFW